MKALVGAFNKEKALVGAFSVIVQLHRWIVSQHYLTRSPAHQRIGSGGTGEEAELPQKTEETLPGHSARRIDSTPVSHWIVLCCVMQKCKKY